MTTPLRRRWFQFSLRDLFLLTLIVALLMWVVLLKRENFSLRVKYVQSQLIRSDQLQQPLRDTP
jgi:hypothetical protein